MARPSPSIAQHDTGELLANEAAICTFEADPIPLYPADLCGVNLDGLYVWGGSSDARPGVGSSSREGTDLNIYRSVPPCLRPCKSVYTVYIDSQVKEAEGLSEDPETGSISNNNLIKSRAAAHTLSLIHI